jgi:hypothetical protein
MSPEDRERQVFVTGTLPGSTWEAMREFSRLSGYVVKLVQTYLPRTLSVSAKELSSVWVWEQQERGALHLHAVFQCPSSVVANRLVILWRLIWVKVLRAAQSKASCDLFARQKGGTWEGREQFFVTDAEIVRLSVDRYLSKYVSKGGSGIRALFPARWYGASRLIREQLSVFVAENSFHLPFSLAAWVELEDVKRGILRAFERFSPKGGKDASQWFQSWSVQVFGFMLPSLTPFDCVSAIFAEIRECLIGDTGRGIMSKSERKPQDIASGVRLILSVLPLWTKLQLQEDFESALGVGLTVDSISSREGFAHFGACLDYLCSVNDSSSVEESSWPKYARERWRALEDIVSDGIEGLPGLKRV